MSRQQRIIYRRYKNEFLRNWSGYIGVAYLTFLIGLGILGSI